MADRLREGVPINHEGGYLAQWVQSLVLLRQLHTCSHTTKGIGREVQQGTPQLCMRHLLSAVLHQVHRPVFVLDPFQR